MIEEMERKFRLTVKEFFLEPQKLVKYIKTGLITIAEAADFSKISTLLIRKPVFVVGILIILNLMILILTLYLCGWNLL